MREKGDDELRGLRKLCLLGAQKRVRLRYL